ncbi:glycosyltransferase, partial [Chitinimonas prasina]|uniref:glycosyltransferase n=1 Tax=Chitinimonas prasina TaxID=1434937 RepID=UPI0024E16488
MKTLIAFSDRWGTQFGGINSFNQDLLTHFAIAFHGRVRTVCVVLETDDAQILEAKDRLVQLVSLNLIGRKGFPADLAPQAKDALQAQGVEIDGAHTVWLGHDRITGGIAIRAAQHCGGKSALIHHMSYKDYESFCENSAMAHQKFTEQKTLFEQADIKLAVGPWLRDALVDMLDESHIAMLVPGMPDIQVRQNPSRNFKGFISGRLSDDAKKLKQGHLGVAAFANAIKKASVDTALPDVLHGTNQPALTLRGVDFEQNASSDHAEAEAELKNYAEHHAGRVFPMNALPFTTNRAELFADLRNANVAMMPSWHEGFGLVGWEAIAAGVPLIVSQKSGLYRLLHDYDDGIFKNLVHPIDVLGSHEEPFFKDRDLEQLTQLILEVAKNPQQARDKAIRLRQYCADKYSWANCAQALAEALNWEEVVRPPIAQSAPKHQQVQAESAPMATTSKPMLEMPRPVWRPDAGLSHSRLLQAEEAVLPFDADREPFLREQLDWAKSIEYPISLRLLTGVGGTGKTRLALELCLRLNEEGWQSGFLPNKDAQIENTVRSLALTKQPVCLVIDYAETRQQELLKLLKTLLKASLNHPFRIVLLARDGGEWWDLLAGKDAECEALLGGRATTGPYTLPKLHDSQASRLSAYRRAMAAFAERLATPELLAIPHLADDHFGHPLYVQMVALLALHGEQPGSAEAVARALIGHERRYWQKVLADIPASATPHEESASLFMALATLVNGLHTPREGEALWVDAGEDKARFKSLFGKLAPLYPGRQGVQALRPDLLGEALVAQVLLGVNGANLLRAVLGHKQASVRRSALTVLARLLRHRAELADMIEPLLGEYFLTCADDFVAVMIETPGPLSHSIENAFSLLNTQRKNQVSGILVKHLTDETIPLVDLGVMVFKAQLTKIECKAGRITSEDQANKGRTLGDLATWLSWQGLINEAEKNAFQSLEIMEKLARAKPGRFEPDWALSLSNYASHLSDLGRSEEAAEKALQALEILEKLARAKPERFEPEWATSLSNYASHLGNLGRSEEAAEKTLQALEILEKLARAKPERFEPEWARSLSNYASQLSNLGRSEEAAEKALQALEIREKLARAKPERFEPDWATSLSNYASHLGDLGRSEEAAEKALQALEIREKLARAKPERF